MMDNNRLQDARIAQKIEGAIQKSNCSQENKEKMLSLLREMKE